MRLSFVLLISLAALGCGNKEPKATASPTVTEAPAQRPTAARTRLHLSLRSTPAGAEAAVDGRPVGTTPVAWEMDADGQPHEFTFVLDGYGMERYRFPPVKDGVVHARMRPLQTADAGP